MDFREILNLSIFSKSLKKVQFSLKSNKNDGHFTWWPTNIFDQVGAELLHVDWRTDGKTDMTKLIVAFRNFANATKNEFCIFISTVFYTIGNVGSITPKPQDLKQRNICSTTPTLRPIHWVAVALYPAVKRPRHKDDQSPHLKPMLRKSVMITPVPQTRS